MKQSLQAIAKSDDDLKGASGKAVVWERGDLSVVRGDSTMGIPPPTVTSKSIEAHNHRAKVLAAIEDEYSGSVEATLRRRGTAPLVSQRNERPEDAAHAAAIFGHPTKQYQPCAREEEEDVDVLAPAQKVAKKSWRDKLRT